VAVIGLAALATTGCCPRGGGSPSGRLRRLLGVEAAVGAPVMPVAALLANTASVGEVAAAAYAAWVRGGANRRSRPSSIAPQA
jgi:hypothetical protein